jgi:glycosyltransferase involved in cell wall biosynthesis
MKEQSLVTITVPVYNGEKYIINALSSIRDQTYTNFICHIVNNASTDKTGELVSRFIENDPRFILHNHEEFVSMVENWNRTVQCIEGKAKYFHLIQADDIITPDCLESHISLLEMHPQAGIASSYRMVGEKIKGYGLDYFDGSLLNGKEVIVKQLTGEINILGNATQNFYRVEHLKKLDFYPEIFIPEDFHFDHRLALEVLLISDLVFSFRILCATRTGKTHTATKTTVRRLNTSLHGRENTLNRFRIFFPELNEAYVKVRRKYAFFMLLNYLKFDKNRINWHKEHLRRKIRIKEYLAGLFSENIFTRAILLIRHRYFTRTI